MDLVLLEKGLEYMRRKKKWAIVLGALGFTGYGAYRMYNSPSVVKKRQRLLKLFAAFVSVAEIVSDSAETIGILSKDLKQFIKSDSNQIPQSLRQISKITSSNEFSDSLTRITRASTVGILQGHELEISKNGGSPGFIDRAIDKLFSDAGSGFASVVVGSLARNLVMAFYSEDSSASKQNKNIERWIELACVDKCRELIGDCIKLFVRTAATVYLEKTMNINTYNEIFSALTNPKNEERVKDVLVSVCNGGIETLIGTSHQLWMENSISASNCYKKLEFEDFGDQEKRQIGREIVLSPLRSNGWVSKVSSTLAVPSNRKFVLDAAGIVTFETIRSFLEFLLEKLSECVKTSVDVVNQEVVDRGVEAMRYMSDKPSAIASVCLTLCFHILNSPWILAPAY